MVFTIKEKLKSFYIVSSVVTLLLLVSIYESSYIRNSETYSNVLENTETKGSYQFTRKLTFWGQNNERVDLENEGKLSKIYSFWQFNSMLQYIVYISPRDNNSGQDI
jgi:hypothetical protein